MSHREKALSRFLSENLFGTRWRCLEILKFRFGGRTARKLREFPTGGSPGTRAVAALSNVELISALLSCNQQLALAGLELRIINGVVSLLTTEVRNRARARISAVLLLLFLKSTERRPRQPFHSKRERSKPISPGAILGPAPGSEPKRS